MINTTNQQFIAKISKENISEVKYCIKMNINALEESIDYWKNKLKQTKEISRKIDNGYAFSKPLSIQGKINTRVKIMEYKEEIKFYKSINLDSLITSTNTST